MKKIKLLTAVSTVAALGAIAPVAMTVTSCNKGGDTPTPTPVVKTLLNIKDNVLYGFNPKLSKSEIESKCKGTLTIPSTVVQIANYAFCDKITGESLIPDSVKNLVFEENIDLELDSSNAKTYKVVGYSALHNEQKAPQAAIGDCAFKNAPFTSIQLPVGSGYDVGASAFEGIKISCLEFPHPRYNTLDDIDPEKYEGTEEKCGCWRGFLTEVGTDYGSKLPKYITSHRINVRERAFFNIPTLKSVILSMFMVNENDKDYDKLNIFSLADSQYGKVKFLDASKVYSPYQYANGSDIKEEEKVSLLEVVNPTEQAIFKSGAVKTIDALHTMLTMNNPGLSYDNPTERFAMAISPFFYDTGDQGSQTKVNNLFATAMYLAIIPGAGSGGFVSSPQGCILASQNNLSKDPETQATAIDMLDNSNVINANISIANKAIQPVDIPLLKNDIQSVVPQTGFRGDMEFKNVKFNWTTGEGTTLGLRQIRIGELPFSKQQAFLNNQFTLTWDTAPTKGDVVEITFDLYYTQMKRYTPNIKAVITFTE